MPHEKMTASSQEQASPDWASAPKRLERATAVLDESRASDLQEKRRILKSRAVALAKEAGDGKQTGECVEVVEFLLAFEHYAIESRHVREVFSLRDLTPLPCTPPHILGIANLRGQIIPIIDLKRLFEIPTQALTEFNKVLLIHAEAMEVGILADVILGMKSLPQKDIHPPPTTFTGARAEYAHGVTKDRLVVLDAGKMLTDARIIVHEEVGV